MTEVTQGSSQGLENASQQQAVSQPVASEPSQNSGAASARSFTQAEVDRIVGGAKRDAVDTYKRLQVEQPEYFARKYGEQPAASQQSVNQNTPQNPQANQVSTPVGMTQDEIRRMAAEEVQRSMEHTRTEEQRKARQQQEERIVADFFTKLNTEKDTYPDLDKKMANLDLSKMPNTVWLSKDLDHKTLKSVYDHFGDHPEKAVQIEQLTYFKPQAAFSKLQQLVQSIKDNETVANIKLPNAPLSQTRPGNSGLGSSGQGLSIAEARQKYRG